MVVLGKHTQTLRHKKTQPVKWITQGGYFQTTHKTNVELLLPYLDTPKSVMWSFHVDYLQKHSRYEMIVFQDLWLEIKLDLCLSGYTVRGNKGMYKEYTAPMQDPYDLCDDASLIN